MNSPDPSAGASETNTREPRFRAANPAFYTVLISFFLATLFSGGLTIFALVPLAGESPPFLVAYGSMSPAFGLSVAGIVLIGWIASGLVRRRWLQVIVCSIVLLTSAWFSLMLAGSVFVAGMKH